MTDTVEKIDGLLSGVCPEDAPGLSVIVKKHGEILLKESYGICDITSRQKIDSNTCFNIASLTKQFTAFGILLLEAAGKISLDQKLGVFFPHYNKKTGGQVTVLQLLTHSSGIVDHYPYINTNTIKHTTDADVLESIQNIDTTWFVPGTMYRYSNTGYCLLALIIESVSGMSYAEFMQKHIFDPAGMKSSFFWSKQKVPAIIAKGYEPDTVAGLLKPSGPEENVFFTTEGDGGLYTSISDYTRWLNVLQYPGVFTPAVIEKNRKAFFAIEGYKKLFYGCGWFIDTSKVYAKIYHCGSNGGYRSYSFTIPSEDYVIAVFSNRSDLNPEMLVFTMNEWLIPAYAPFTGVEVLTS